jgi:pimeloyl-ACP methyl ester carboxylesterase
VPGDCFCRQSLGARDRHLDERAIVPRVRVLRGGLIGFALLGVACGRSPSSANEVDAGLGVTGVDDASASAPTDASIAVPADDASVSAPTDASTDASLDAPTDASILLRSWSVGVTTRTFVDTTRPTPANGTAPAQTSRTLVTEIWYPAALLEDGGADDAGAGSGAPITPTRDVPIASGGPYPLVLFVHGSSSSRLVYTFLTTALAQAGYVVAAADFPLTALGTPGGSSDLHVSYQVGDLSFLCDQLKAVSSDAGDELAGAVDGLAYAVVGHSTGGAVAELAAFAGNDSMITHDPRVVAVIPLSGDACMFAPWFFKNRDVPIFVIGASDDLFVRFPNSGEWVYTNTSEPHLAAEIVGGQHMGFTDIPLDDSLLGPVPTNPTSPLAVTLQAYGDAGACLPEPEGGTAPLMSFDDQHALVVQMVTAYLDAELRGDPALLTAVEGSSNPLVVVQQ